MISAERLRIPGIAIIMMDRKPLQVAAILLSFGLKIFLAVCTYGTNDALTWEANVEKIHREGGLAVYRDGVVPHFGAKTYFVQEFSHPPFMTHLLAASGQLVNVTGIPIRFWIRLTCSVADLVSLMLLLGILRRSRIPVMPGLVLLVILSPVSILISGFHVNTDPIMMTFVLLSIYLVLRGSPAWIAGCAMGMAVNIKIVPILFMPAVCLYLRDWKKATSYATGAGMIFVAGSLPEILQDPLLIYHRLSRYSSSLGHWGISRLSWTLLPEEMDKLYSHLMRFTLLFSLLAISAWMNSRKAVPLVLQIACVSFLTLSLTPGFGIQYLSWLVPWTALLSVRSAITFHTLAGLFLLSFYHRASHGTWYLANALETPVWAGSVVYLGLLLWLAICVIAVGLGRRIARERQLRVDFEASTAPQAL